MLISCFPRCSIFLVALYMILFLFFISEAAPNYRHHFCPNTTTYDTKSAYQLNLNSLLYALSNSNNARNRMFYNATAGHGTSDRAYGSFMCRGDLTNNICHDCVVTATREIVERCSKEKRAYIWFDECMLRYDNTSFFSRMDQSASVFMSNMQNVRDPDRFSRVLGDAMNDLATRVSSGQSNNNSGQMKGFGTNETKFTSFQTIYSPVQCTPDLSGPDCDRCLRVAIGQLPRCCGGREGATVLHPSCNIRYETYPFYSSTAAPPPTSPMITPPPAPENGGISAQVIISIVVAAVVSVLLFITVGFCFLRRRPKKCNVVVQETIDGIEMSIAESLQYDLSTIWAATDNFSTENKIGEGGFGDVFKGKLPNGQEIAVKRLSRSSRQGAQEFKNELVLVSKLQHRNLVKLVGFCFEREEKISMYEFVPNKSLHHYLFDPERQQLLDWTTRYKIIRGIAHGILYLHEDSCFTIIHRNLNASNILLDRDMDPKISNFRMAKIFGVDQSQGNTSRIIGTFGYMAPEYAMYGQFSIKSDVFSFGILLLEIVSGKKITNFFQSEGSEDLLSHAWKLWREGRPLDLVDSALGDSFVRNEIVRCIHIGLLCVQEYANGRPTMASVVLMLNSHTNTLAVPLEPAFFVHSRMNTIQKPLESDESSMPWSVNEMSISELYPR